MAGEEYVNEERSFACGFMGKKKKNYFRLSVRNLFLEPVHGFFFWFSFHFLRVLHRFTALFGLVRIEIQHKNVYVYIVYIVYIMLAMTPDILFIWMTCILVFQIGPSIFPCFPFTVIFKIEIISTTLYVSC